jgi:hypothetical protein
MIKQLILAATTIGVGALVACGVKPAHELKFAEQPVERAYEPGKLPSFLLVSDTQYAVPFTDYDLRYRLGEQLIELPPALSTIVSKSFYRNAVSHLSVPLAFEAVIEREQANGVNFGLFGGDMAEFSCVAESEHIFQMLERHPEVKFIITIGNHDAAFHGAFDTDAISRGGTGEWDRYAWQLWNRVCEHEGGPLTKTRFIERILDYYAKVWGLDWRKNSIAGSPAPRGRAYRDVITQGNWQLDFEVQLSFESDAESHRQSHFYQRFTYLDEAKGVPRALFTSLDTTDYGSRPVLCSSGSAGVNAASHLVQIGLGGGISRSQIDWLEHRPAVEPGTPHFALSHYLPFQNVKDLSSCDATFGAHCLGTRLSAALTGAVYIYGHVHEPFAEGDIEQTTCDAGGPPERPCQPADSSDKRCERVTERPVVRLPALIDNKSYVVFDGAHFAERKLKAMAGVAGEAPFAQLHTSCEQRVYEYQELGALLACAKAQLLPAAGAPATGAKCLDPRAVAKAASLLQPELCHASARGWVSKNPVLWQRLLAEPAAGAGLGLDGACHGWSEDSRWRCILRGLSYEGLQSSGLNAKQLTEAGELILSASRPLRADHDKEHR